MVGRMAAVGLLAVVLGGCSQAAADDVGGGGSAQTTYTSEPISVGNQVRNCERFSEFRWDKAESTMDMVQAAGEDAECFRAITFNHASRIDRMRAEVGGSLLAPRELTSARAFDGFRTGGGTTALCDVRDQASPNFGGSLQRVERVSCAARREKQLAQLAAAWVAWGDGTALRLAERGTPEDVRAHVPALVQSILGNDSTLDPALTTAHVTESLDGTLRAAEELCLLLADAGEMGGGSDARLQANGCLSNALGMLEKELAETVGAGER